MLISPESLAVIGGAIALAGGLAGSAIGIGIAGSAGAATLSEEPGQLRNVILLASLPMTQTFYGLITLILILVTVRETVGTIGGGMGFAVLGIGVITGAAEAFSGAYQGSVCASGISLLPKTKGRILTNAMMLAVFVELIGVLGLVFAIMALAMLGLF
ncbi:MAG: ATPase [Dehalococcoidia bacterium]|jgi:V/A-type H+-transporting ATPase subunit K|nr:MAG: ATPase [Dehalococcoidia bacterium]